MKTNTGILAVAILCTFVCIRSNCVADQMSMNVVGYEMEGDTTGAVVRLKTPGDFSSYEIQKETAILKGFGIRFEIFQEDNGEYAMPPWYQWQGGSRRSGLIDGAFTALTIDGRAAALAKESIYNPPAKLSTGGVKMPNPVFDRSDNKEILYELKDGCIVTKDFGAIPVALCSSKVITNSSPHCVLIFTDAQLAELRKQAAESKDAPPK